MCLCIKYVHAFETSYVPNCYKALSHYVYLFTSPHLKQLQTLEIKNNALNVDWAGLKLLSAYLMPELKLLRVPVHAMEGIAEKYPEDIV